MGKSGPMCLVPTHCCVAAGCVARCQAGEHPHAQCVLPFSCCLSVLHCQGPPVQSEAQSGAILAEHGLQQAWQGSLATLP